MSHVVSVRLDKRLRELVEAHKKGTGIKTDAEAVRDLLRMVRGDDPEARGWEAGFAKGYRQFFEELREVTGRFKERGRQPK